MKLQTISKRMMRRVFLRAAKDLLHNRASFCCPAISFAFPLRNRYVQLKSECHNMFEYAFKPKEVDSFGPWWSANVRIIDQRDRGGPFLCERIDKEARILALLLCAEMCRE